MRVSNRALWLIPSSFTLFWLIFVVASGHVDRVTDYWRSSLTMVFGSFVAGSTPQGGGAIAFPVFTKVLEIPPSVARSFGLVIQATGMVMASVAILLSGRRIDVKALLLGVSGGSMGFLVGALALGDRSTPFWDSVIPAPYVKVSFTIAVTMVATIVWLCAGRKFPDQQITGWTKRSELGLIAFTFVGGIASSLTGSGVDVFLFLFVVLVAGLHPGIAIPTSVISMAWTSVLGLILYGFIDGQLNIGLDGSDVVRVAGEPITRIAAQKADLFGIWLAAAPIVVWGAPFGSWVASKLPDNVLIRFVAAMAIAELVTTIVFLDALRTDTGLIVYGVVGLAVALLGTVWLSNHGARVFGFSSSE